MYNTCVYVSVNTSVHVLNIRCTQKTSLCLCEVSWYHLRGIRSS